MLCHQGWLQSHKPPASVSYILGFQAVSPPQPHTAPAFCLLTCKGGSPQFREEWGRVHKAQIDSALPSRTLLLLFATQPANTAKANKLAMARDPRLGPSLILGISGPLLITVRPHRPLIDVQSLLPPRADRSICQFQYLDIFAHHVQHVSLTPPGLCLAHFSVLLGSSPGTWVSVTGPPDCSILVLIAGSASIISISLSTSQKMKRIEHSPLMDSAEEFVL